MFVLPLGGVSSGCLSIRAPSGGGKPDTMSYIIKQGLVWKAVDIAWKNKMQAPYNWVNNDMSRGQFEGA